jgi:hypothetical protein
LSIVLQYRRLDLMAYERDLAQIYKVCQFNVYERMVQAGCATVAIVYLEVSFRVGWTSFRDTLGGI